MPFDASAPLGQGQRRTLRALAPIVLPSDVLLDSLVDDVVDDVGIALASFGPLARRALSAAVLVIEVAGVRHGRRFSNLPQEAAKATIARLSSGPAGGRRALRAVRDVLVVAYFDQPTVKERLGYRPQEWTAATATRWHEQWDAEAERHRELLRTRLMRPGERR